MYIGGISVDAPCDRMMRIFELQPYQTLMDECSNIVQHCSHEAVSWAPSFALGDILSADGGDAA